MKQDCNHIWIAASLEVPLVAGYVVFYCTAGCKQRIEVAEGLVQEFLES
jgi:hypothetical protein